MRMQNAETVTFGGGGIDRAAHLRDTPGKIAQLRAHPYSRALALWRGKPLYDETGGCLAWLAHDHPVLCESSIPPVFLGLDQGKPLFAFDISEWHDPQADAEHLNSFADSSRNHHPLLPNSVVFAELRAVMALLSPLDAEQAATAKGLFAWHATHGFCARCGVATTVSKAGWQRSCPACNAQHFPRTDPVVIMLITHGNQVLLGRSHGWPDGMYSLLAGFMEPGETVEAAVRREVHEETGIPVGPVSYLASQPWPFPSSLMIGCAGTALTTGICLDPVELDDAKWVSREDMAETQSGHNPAMKPARIGSIAQFLIHNWLSDTLG
jgi:NAD+ diphosphatase